MEDAARGAAVVGHADGGDDSGGPRPRDQRVELHPRLRSADRQGAVAARRQLEDHRADAGVRRRRVRRRQRPRARTADFRRPAEARGDITLAAGKTSSDAVAWSRTGRGPYMPTPLVYKGMRLRARQQRRSSTPTNSATGDEVYRQRLTKSATASAPRRWPPTARSTCRTRTATWWSSRPDPSSRRSPSIRWGSC